MPNFDYICKQESCIHGLVIVERWKRNCDPEPKCQSCGEEMRRIFSPFAITFCGAITSRYNNSKLENPNQEGHHIWCKKGPGGEKLENPQRVWVDTWQKRKEVMKAEGLIDGGASQVSASSDGKKASAAGMPGAWI